MKKRNKHGLRAANFPISVAWAVDFDYIKDLSERDKEWLSCFSDMHYGADFRGEFSKTITLEDRRKSYTNKNVANADAYPGLCAFDLMSDIDSEGTASRNFQRPSTVDKKKRKLNELIPSTTHFDDAPPEYLNSEEYKQALKAFRDKLNPTRRNVNPKETPEYLAAKERLEQVIKHGYDSNHDPR